MAKCALSWMMLLTISLLPLYNHVNDLIKWNSYILMSMGRYMCQNKCAIFIFNIWIYQKSSVVSDFVVWSMYWNFMKFGIHTRSFTFLWSHNSKLNTLKDFCSKIVSQLQTADPLHIKELVGETLWLCVCEGLLIGWSVMGVQCLRAQYSFTPN